MVAKKALSFLLAAGLSAIGLTTGTVAAVANQQTELYTVNVADQAAAADARHFLTHQGVTYFSSYSLTYGRSIWSITQAEREPVHVVDASPGTWTGRPGNLFAFGDNLFFTDDPTFEYDGIRPFMFNLVSKELSEIKIDADTSFSSASNFVEAGGDVYFVDASHAIWKIDTVTGFASVARQLSFPLLQFNSTRLDGDSNIKLLATGDMILLVEDVAGAAYNDPNRYKDELWVYDTANDLLVDTGLIGAKLFGNYEFNGETVAVVTDATNFQQFSYDTARGYAVRADGVPVRLGSWSVAGGFPAGFANLNGDLITLAPSGSNAGFNFWVIEPSDGELRDITADIYGGHVIASPQSVLEVDGNLVFAANVNSTGITLHSWNGTETASVLGQIAGINADNDIYQWTNQHSWSRNLSAHEFGGELLMNLYLDESIGFEPYLIDPTSGSTTLVADLNKGSDGSRPDTDCFATLGDFDYMTASVPLQSERFATDVILELKGEDELLKYSVIELGGIQNACGFSVGTDGLYFTGEDDDSSGIFRMNLDRTFDKLIEITNHGDFGYLYGDKYFWAADSDYDYDMFVYDLSEANPSLAVTQLTGEDESRNQISFGGVQIEEDSVEELIGIGSNLFFTGDDGDGDFLYRVSLEQEPLVFEAINESINANPNDLNPQDLVSIDGKLYFFDQNANNKRALFSFDPATSTVDLVIDPATIEGNESFLGWNRAKPFKVGDAIYGVFYNDNLNQNQLYRTTSTGVELVTMPENFVFECAAPAGSDYAISDEQGTAYFYGDPENPRLLPYSFSGDTSALCDSVSSAQGTYLALPEYPFSSGYWSSEPGYLGKLAPVAVERLGQPVTETLAVPFSNDPTSFDQEAPGVPGTPVASRVPEGVKLIWTAPTTGDTPTSYIVTSSPSGATCEVTDLEAICTGLTEGTSYTFSVRGINGGGSSPTAGPSNAITYSTSEQTGFSPPQLQPVNPNLPVVTPARFGHNAGGKVEIDGTKLDKVTKAYIDDKEVDVALVNGKLIATIPEDLTPGTYNLKLDGSFGSVILQDYLTVLGSTTVTGNQDDMRTWTSIHEGKDKVRVIYKNPVGVGKVQFMLNGQEVAWVRATDATDPKLRGLEVNGVEVPYLVRTVELTKGIKNAFEIYVDGVRVWRAAYFGR